jgi:hypothetical protein
MVFEKEWKTDTRDPDLVSWLEDAKRALHLDNIRF